MVTVEVKYDNCRTTNKIFVENSKRCKVNTDFYPHQECNNSLKNVCPLKFNWAHPSTSANATKSIQAFLVEIIRYISND